MSSLPVMKSASKVNGIVFILMLSGMLVYSLPYLYSFSSNQTQVANLYADGELLRKFESYYD